MKAFGRTIVISPIKEEVKNKIGLVITDVNDRTLRYKLAEVYRVGDSVEGIKEGDKIYYDNTHANEIRIEGDKYLIINEGDIRIII
jgi:co-chaperonin GroES (HSP10)